MTRPTQYFVDYADPDLYKQEVNRHRADDPEQPEAHADPTRYYKSHDCTTLDAAREFAKAHEGVVYERRNLEDVTPEGDPLGLLWDWEEEMVDDSAIWRGDSDA